MKNTFLKIFIICLFLFGFLLACNVQKKVVNEPAPAEPVTPAVDTEYYARVEVPAQFNGADINAFYAYLKKNIKYPAAALKKKQQGLTVVQFGVDWNGNVQVFSVLKSSGFKILDDEVVRVLKSSPPWTPAKMKETKVGQLLMVQVKFNARTRSIEIK